MATPIWNEKEKRWTLRIKKEGIERKFTSKEPGIKGKKIVLAKARAAEGNRDYKITVEKEAERYLEDVKARNEYSTYYVTCHYMSQYILPHIGKYRVANIRVQDLQEILNKARKIDGSVLSYRTLRTISLTIKAFFNFCRKDGLEVPSDIRLIIPKNAPKHEREILHPAELKRLFDASEPFADDNYIYYFQLGVLTGMRPGELLGLKWEDYNGLSLTIRRSINSLNMETTGKTDNARRTIYLGDIARGVLEAQREKTKHLNSEWIFCNRQGKVSTQNTIKEHMNKINKVLGTKITAYCLRHTFISLMQGTNLADHVIQGLVGHSASMRTFEVYGHEIREDKIQEAEIINLALAKKIQ